MRAKHQARKLAKQLTESGVPAVDLDGNLSQPARDRNLAAFSTGQARVLVATDIAARGVHVDGIELVVHIDPPAEHKAYLHRSGRMARAGNAGDVVTVVLPDQRKDTHALMRRAGIRVTPQEVTVDSAAVHAVAGDMAPYRAPAPKKAAPSHAICTCPESTMGRNAGALTVQELLAPLMKKVNRVPVSWASCANAATTGTLMPSSTVSAI